MEEIIDLLNKVRRKYEYAFSGYIQLIDETKDDIYQEVLLSLLTKYKQNKIDMANLENYIFITYRNHVYSLSRKTIRRRENSDKIDWYEEDLEDGFGEVYDDDTTRILNRIKEIIGEERYNQLVEYYKHLLLNRKDRKKWREENHLIYSPRTFQKWRKKIRDDFNK